MKRQFTVTFLFATIFSGTLLAGNFGPGCFAESNVQADATSNQSPAETKRELKREKKLEKKRLKEELKQEKEQELKELKTPAPAQMEKLETPSTSAGEKIIEHKAQASKAVKKVKEEGKAKVKPETKAGAKPLESTGGHKPGGKHFSGNVSWYGSKFNGRKTASGEIFDMNKKTAAHRTLPFFTRVLVEDPKTGKTVVVKVNDRGPFVHSRVMDLSREGARQLGTLLHGTAYVDCLVVGGDVQ